MDQLTVIVQSLAPIGISQDIGTEKEVTVGGFGAHRAPLQELPTAQAALDGRVASVVPLSESSKIFKPKSRLAINPGWAARFEICVPSWVSDGATGLLIDQLTTIVQVAAPSGIVQPLGTLMEPSVGGGGGTQHICPGPLHASGDETPPPYPQAGSLGKKML
jgi:hypothetical protein